jgi:hypothetical protein
MTRLVRRRRYAWKEHQGMAGDSITYRASVAPFPNPGSHLQSLILATSGEEMFCKAIALTLAAPLDGRAELVERLLEDIVAIVSANPEMRPWTFSRYVGSDGSRIFSGGIGLSLVVDSEGRLWRARTYEDFETTHRITATTCEVETMTPKYDQMREYRRR